MEDPKPYGIQDHEVPSYLEKVQSQLPALHLLMLLGWKYLTPEEAVNLRGGRLGSAILEPVLVDHIREHCRYEFKTLRRGQTFLSALAGPTCDSFDTLSLNEEIPELYLDDVVYVKNIGAYSCASATSGFNGFPPAKIVML